MEPQWCLVGNIVPEGTKHFSGGTKVYCLTVRWGDGYEKAYVIGRHRGRRSLVRIVQPTKRITNWRAKLVYEPAVLKRLIKYGSWETREDVEQCVEVMRKRQASQVKA